MEFLVFLLLVVVVLLLFIHSTLWSKAGSSNLIGIWMSHKGALDAVVKIIIPVPEGTRIVFFTHSH
jgi:hypothetical protein